MNRDEGAPEGTPESDLELIHRAQGGEGQAVTLLYVRYRRRILNYVYRFTGNRATAEELTQETFLRVVEHLHRFRPRGSVAGWIYTIAGNLARHALRRQRGRPELSLDEPLELEEDTVSRAEAIAHPQEGAAQGLERKETGELIQQALTQVPVPFREVVILCDIEGYSYAQAAEILGCPMNTVGSRLARGRMKLAQLLGYLKKEVAG